MWADGLDELFAIADHIGLARRWLQQPPKASWLHFDVSLALKAKAIEAGAILTDKYGPLEHLARLSGDHAKLDRISVLRARNVENSISGLPLFDSTV